jgi:hypothetical protein
MARIIGRFEMAASGYLRKLVLLRSFAEKLLEKRFFNTFTA